MRERGRGVSFFFLSLEKSPRPFQSPSLVFCLSVFVSVPHERKNLSNFSWTSSLLKKEGRTKKNKDGKEKRQNTDNKTKDKQDQKGVKKRQRRKNQIEIKSK